jgi:hypothetical protein
MTPIMLRKEKYKERTKGRLKCRLWLVAQLASETISIAYVVSGAAAIGAPIVQ